jgi:uncharacterized membrane protein YkoI
MSRLISRTATTVAALGALALGGSAIAGAATSSNSNSTSSSSSQGSAAAAPAGKPAGRHVGANGKQEQALDAATGAKVKAAALAKVPGATVERVETDVDHGSPYEAHLVKSDGTHLEVLVNESFAVTAVNTMQQHP